jgi:hypothetical protein
MLFGKVSGGDGQVLVSGAIGFGLVVGWAGGFAGTTSRALAYRLATGGLVVLAIWASSTVAALAALGGIASATVGHEAFTAALHDRRRRA